MDADKDTRQQLKRIERELKEVRGAVEESWASMFFSGLIRGGGFVIGTVVMIALAGWLLSIFGILPGFEDITTRLREILEAQAR